MRGPTVVVGIDGSRTAEGALDWAAAEATRRSARLLIAHGGDAYAVPGGTSIVSDYGRSLMSDAQASVFESEADCEVDTVIDEQHPVPLLTRLSEDADLLVVGSHGLGEAMGTMLGSVAFRVAGHARCPVVIVPRAGQFDTDHRQRPVAVGVSATEGSRVALESAFVEAALRGVGVHAVHAWGQPDWTGAATDAVYRSGQDFERSQAALLAAQIAPLRARYPQVPVTATLSPAPVADALLRVAVSAQLLVIGCRFSDGHLFSRLGPTTARVLHTTSIPVLVTGRRMVDGPATDTSTTSTVSGRSIETVQAGAGHAAGVPCASAVPAGAAADTDPNSVLDPVHPGVPRHAAHTT